MITTPAELWKLPVPATSLVKGADINVLPKCRCEISFQIEGNDRELVMISLLFEGIEAFKYTFLTSCNAEMFNTAYAKLVRLGETPWLSELRQTYASGSRPAKELQHLMICFDDGPCFEFACLSFVEQRS
jgi:hypothetical protein